MGNSAKPQACHNCKKRKVKCDFREPVCLRCENAQIPCRGYQRETVFIIRTPGKERLVLRDNSPASTLPSFNESLQMLRLQFQKPTGSRSQLRNQSLTLLKRLYLPQRSPASLEISPVFGWLPIVCCLQGPSHALDHSLYTFCVIQVAITKSGSVSVEEASQTYYDSLQMLKAELEDERAAKKDEILAAISVLSTCELFVCPTDHAWQAHAQGISEISRIRGDLDISTPIQRSLYFRIRLVLLFEALTKRLPGPKANSQFRKRVSTTSTQEFLTQIIDIAWEVPAVLGETDLLMTSNMIDENMRERILNQLFGLIAELQDYQQRYRDELERPAYWAMPSTAEFPADVFFNSKLFPFALSFQSIETATSLLLSWAISLQVYCSILNVYHCFANTTIPSLTSSPAVFENHTKPLPNTRYASLQCTKEEADKLARHLCQSIEYCYRSENGTIGPQLTCYAQWVLKVYFRQVGYERELAWCQNIRGIRGAGFQSGLALMCFED